jgi:endo-1,4-beta-xylanase
MSTGGRDGSGGATSSTGGVSGTGGVVGSGGSQARDGGMSLGGRDAGAQPGTGGRQGTGGTTTISTGPLKKWFGNIDTRGSIRSDFASMWDQFSPENAGKWGSVQGSQGSFNWSSLDRMYKYCEDNHIVFKEHCFIWGSQQPSWVNNSNAESAVKAWMKAFCERFPNTKVIDVVNEPLHPVPAYRDGIGGAGSSGWDWIVNALKWAKEACPNAVLVVNDYNTIEYSSENGRIISLVNAVKKAGGPIDAVGCQSHDIAKVSQSTMTSYGQKIIDQTGLPLHITEMDIGITDDNQQLQKMKDFVTWAWGNPDIHGITYWGYIVGATWRNGTGLMTDSGSKRPSLTWLLDFLGR